MGHFISDELSPSSLFVKGAVSKPISPRLGIVGQIFADDDMGVAVLAMVSPGVSPILAGSVDRVSSPEVQLRDVSYGSVSASWDWRLSVVDDEGLSTGSVQVVSKLSDLCDGGGWSSMEILVCLRFRRGGNYRN